MSQEKPQHPNLECNHLFSPPEPMPMVGKWPSREYCTRCQQWIDTNAKPQHPILKAHLEGVEMFKAKFACEKYSGLPDGYESWDNYDTAFLSFLTTYAINILNGALEAGPGEETASLKRHEDYVRGFNYSRSSFRAAIDEGIEGIKKGDV